MQFDHAGVLKVQAQKHLWAIIQVLAKADQHHMQAAWFKGSLFSGRQINELNRQLKELRGQRDDIKNQETLVKGLIAQLQSDIEKAKKKIDSEIAPMYKLNWRVDSSNSYWKAILAYLEEQSWLLLFYTHINYSWLTGHLWEKLDSGSSPEWQKPRGA